MEMPWYRIHVWLGNAAAEISLIGSVLLGVGLLILPIASGILVHWSLFAFLLFSKEAFKRSCRLGFRVHDRIKESLECD